MTHTKDLLADELMKLGLMDMSLQARGGYYHDFLSPLATPELQLCEDLHKAALKRPDKAAEIMALRQRVMDGDFDASPAESDEWAKSEEGQEAFAKLMPKKQRLGDAPIEQKYHDEMNALAAFLDERFNGDVKGKDRPTGFVLMVFPFDNLEKGDARCNYISNGADRKDIVTLMKEMIARFEGQPEQKGTA